jgi:hypothetical protein
MKAKKRYLNWALVGLLCLVSLAVLVAVISVFAPFGPAQGPHRPGMGRYLHSGQLLADVRTATGMLQYIFEPEGQPSAA